MWVSKAEYEELRKRVVALERQAHASTEMFTVYGEQYPYSSTSSCQIAVQTVVQYILNHLGLKLQYVPGIPTRADIVKQEKERK